MSMLADKRRKDKWILNPRTCHWSDDSSKFGQRLMEKMGWKSGNGLGANQQGSTEHVKVLVRSDNRGVGFKDRPEDVLQHQEDFAELLQQLGGANTPSTDTPTETAADEIKETSLEMKSLKSRARVHYHKFTRGKDLSRYSAKDLECILGKKPTEPPVAVSSPPLVSDVVTVHGGNMVDYFKDKRKNLGHNWPKTNATEYTDDYTMEERPSFGFGFNPMSDQNHEDLEDAVEDVEDVPDVEVDKQEKKKSKKAKHVETGVDVMAEDVACKETIVGLRKSKKDKSKDCGRPLEEEISVNDSTLPVDVYKKEKKQKISKDIVDEGVFITSDVELTETCEKKKKRKSKKTNVEVEDKNNECQVPVTKSELQITVESRSIDCSNIGNDSSTKKAKKIVLTNENIDDETQTTPEETRDQIKKKKKRKHSQKKEPDASRETDTTIAETEDQVKKKKKRKHPQKEENGESSEIETKIEETQDQVKKKKKRKHFLEEENGEPSEIETKIEETEDQDKKKKKRKHSPEGENGELSAEPVKKRRKSVTFSEELFEVVLIPPREEPLEDEDNEEDLKEEDDEDKEESTKKDSTVDIQIINGVKYINGVKQVLIQPQPRRIFKMKVTIPQRYRENAFDSFPGSNVHELGYAGLNEPQLPQRIVDKSVTVKL